MLSRDHWIKAMEVEMLSLHKNKTWKLVKKNQKTKDLVGCKWIYKLKSGIPGVEKPRYNIC